MSVVVASNTDPHPGRVWIFDHYARPPGFAVGTRHFSLAQAVIRHGGEVTIFAAGMSHLTGKEEMLRGSGVVRTQVVDGVRFVWLRTLAYRGNTWRRSANMLTYFLVAVLAQVGRPAPEVVVGTTVHPFAALAGWFVAKSRGARYIFEIQDLWPQTLVDLGALRSGSLGARVLYGIEAFLVRHAETVITLLPGTVAYLDDRGLPSGHVRQVPNGIDIGAADRVVRDRKVGGADPVASLVEDLEQRRSQGEVVFAYVGTHGLVYRLDVVLHALELANGRVERPIHMVLVGDGPEKTALMELATQLSLRNVTFVDPVPNERVPEILAAADVGVIHTTSTPVYRYGVSFNKLYAYMAARLPIVFGCSTWADPVAAAGAGYTVAPDDPEALSAAFVTVAESTPEARRRMGQAGRDYVEREHDMARIGDTFAEIVGGRDAAVRSD